MRHHLSHLHLNSVQRRGPEFRAAKKQTARQGAVTGGDASPYYRRLRARTVDSRGKSHQPSLTD